MDSSDEQAAAIRRELDGRLQKVAEMEKVIRLAIFHYIFIIFAQPAIHNFERVFRFLHLS